MSSPSAEHDTLATDENSREQVSIAMVEAGMVPGVIPIVLERPEDFGKLSAMKDGDGPVMVRVTREALEGGALAGAAFATFLLGEVPVVARGQIVLLFDGWASDPRELHEIKEVVEFCRGLLLGPQPSNPNPAHARRVLSVLLDEDSLAFEDGKLVHPVFLDLAGAVWLCSNAFADEVYQRSRTAKSGWMRDYGLAHGIREWLIGRGPAPS